jgi:hypothetical protein
VGLGSQGRGQPLYITRSYRHSNLDLSKRADLKCRRKVEGLNPRAEFMKGVSIKQCYQHLNKNLQALCIHRLPGVPP